MAFILKRVVFYLCVNLTLNFAVAVYLNDESNPYKHSQVVDRNGKYFLEWLVNLEEKRIYFNVTVETKGWVGLGLSRKGQMAGADMVIGGVSPNGQAYFKDRYATGHTVPEVDSSQDWTLHSAWESKSHTFLGFSRPFETCDDANDLPVNEDLISVIWAYGERDELTYHFQNRGSIDIYLLDPDLSPRRVQEQFYKNVTNPQPINSIGDWKVWRMNVEQTLPAQDTAYMCTFHRAPRHNKKHHIVGFRPIMRELEQRHMHHLIFHICYPPSGYTAEEIFGRFVDKPGQECYLLQEPSEIPTPYCLEHRHEWAAGGGPIFFPEHVGLPFVEKKNEFYLLQIHYDNPDSLPNLNLKYSLEVYYTDKLRKYDAGLARIGVAIRLPGTPSIMVPPSSRNHNVYGLCGGECTERFFPNGVNVFAAKMHTHLAGQRARFMQVRNGKEMPIVLEENYNFNYQHFRTLSEEKRIFPGDLLYSRCTYDTTDRTGAMTVDGVATRDEMCHSWIHYYPYIRNRGTFSTCLGDIRTDEYGNFLQIYNTSFSVATRQDIVTSPEINAGLTTRQAGARIDWTIANRNKIQDLHRNSPQLSSCPSVDVESIERFLEDGYPVPRRIGPLGEIRLPGDEFLVFPPKQLDTFKREMSCPK